ncbi:MAG TPA: TlyA family RNA methyltransferase [Ktedonobacteraceae bacterium]|jgi:23S rRNA (cytidine1920-2'-O)/16S rRNA (cytidine1409-2'-O)-methyltransferase
MQSKKERLDVALVRQGFAPSRERARALIMAGQVLVDGKLVDKPGTQLASGARCQLVRTPDELKYVSRGGLKLEKALTTFDLQARGLVALDVGASTGGFTQCLLQSGARKVYALDVGRGQLAWTLRTDLRVVVLEGTNIRMLTHLPEPIDCAVVDVSFISLRLVLPPLIPLLRPGAWIVTLVKPQFEAGKADVDRGHGVISDSAIHARVLTDLQAWIGAHTSLSIRGLTDSPIRGREGNQEFLLHLSLG